ncbi:MAG: helix-turn-helix domain containing protein [Acidocella sp.]|nr:helix-turn-helix domain containing protein [Acidocella sp.]
MSVSPARTRMIAAAHELFYQHGVRATGVDRIIAEAGVTKVTFYRHFPTKDDLVLAYLAARHEHWMRWFTDALARYRAEQTLSGRQHQPFAPLLRALEDWFWNPEFRGCAFINAAAELGATLPGALELTAAHKREMVAEIATLLPEAQRGKIAMAAGLAVDGAIIRAQTGADEAAQALEALRTALAALAKTFQG